MWARIKSFILGRVVEPARLADVDYQDQVLPRESMVLASVRPRVTRQAPQHRPPLTIRIAAAATNLAETNITAARDFGLGSESTLALDEQRGQLVMTFPNGCTARYAIQHIGQYNPQAGVFSWAWANPSHMQHLKLLADRIKFIGDEFDEPLLTTATQQLTPDDVVPLVAFAAHEGGMPLVYAMQARGSEQYFLALDTPSFATADSRSMAAPFAAQSIALTPASERLMFDGIEHASHSFAIPHPDGGDIAVVIGDDGVVSARRFLATRDGRVQSSHLPNWGRGFIWPRG